MDLYAGSGGLSHRLAQSGLRIRASVDLNSMVSIILGNNHPDSTIVQADPANAERDNRDKNYEKLNIDENLNIKHVPSNEHLIFNESVETFINEHMDEYETCDVLAAGTPCQTFSIARSNKHDADLTNVQLFIRCFSKNETKGRGGGGARRSSRKRPWIYPIL